MKQILFVFTLLIVFSSAVFAGTVRHTVIVPRPQVENLADGQKVVLDQALNTGKVGEPRLPIWGLNLLLPPGEEAVSISIERGAPISLGSGYKIAPVQKQYPIGYNGPAQPDTPNPEIYNTNSAFPQNLVADYRTDFFRGHGIVAVALNPVTFNPVTGELVYYPHLQVIVNTASTTRATEAYQRMLKRDARTLANLEMQVANMQESALYGGRDDTDVPYYDMLIITHTNMVPLWQTYIDWKTKCGYYIAVETTTDIYANYNGVDNPEKIRNCIIDYYENWDLTYVFIAGDDEFCPHRGLYVSSGYTDNDIAGDCYFAGLDGNWNTDGDIHWGEPGEDDLRAEVYVSRAAVDSETEINNFVNKQMMFQRQPVVNEVETALMAGEDLGWPIWAWEYKEEVRTGNSSWGFITAPFPADWEVRTLYDTPGNIWPNTQLMNLMNQGPIYLNHLGHADVGYMMKLYTSNVTTTNMTNNGINHNFYLIYSQGCYCGSFDNRTTGGSYVSDCITEQFSCQIPTGAVAMITNSRYGWGDLTTTQGSSQYYDKQFFDALWGENIWYASETNTDSKTDCIPYINFGQNRWCFYEINIFCEPILDLWTDEPSQMAPNYAGEIFLGATSLQVTVPGLANARVCLSKDGTIHAVGFTNATGVCNLTITEPLLTLGNADLYITAHNKLPHEGVILVIPPTGPYVVYDSLAIDDALGNNNGQWDYGETVYFDFTVQNVGIANATAVTGAISTTDTLAGILQNTANFGNINLGATSFVNNAFQVNSDGWTENQHIIAFTLISSSDTNSWTSYFSIPVNAPEMEFASLEINDATGNNNGNLDPGEFATLLVTITNAGNCYPTGLYAQLSEADPYISIGTDIYMFGIINPGDSAVGSFTVTVAANCPQEHDVNFNLFFADNIGYTGSGSFTTTVGDITYLPTGPDAYGYSAYDPNDLPEVPVYSWIEISADSGGLGTRINFTGDDQVFQFPLPFDFQYYGMDYDSVSIACNGYICMGIMTVDDYSNSAIPNSDGPPAMIAAYWEDLSPQRTNSGGVWYYYDVTNHLYIVEYNHIEQYSPTNNFETFQVIFYDPAFYQTATGDGRLKVQYKQMSTASLTEGTIGIENPAETIGLQYLFDGALDVHAMPVANGMCILYTTMTGLPTLDVTITPVNPPIVIPATGGSFNYSVLITNPGTNTTNFDVWVMVTMPNGTNFGPVLTRLGMSLTPGGQLVRAMTQVVPASAPSGNYTYIMYGGNYNSGLVYDQSSFDFSKQGAFDNGSNSSDWEITGWEEELSGTISLIPEEYALFQNYPNPFNPVTSISYALPSASYVHLSVYNTIGQQMAVLVDGWQSAGNKSVNLDASNWSSGVYFYRLQAGDFKDMKKMILIK